MSLIGAVAFFNNGPVHFELTRPRRASPKRRRARPPVRSRPQPRPKKQPKQKPPDVNSTKKEPAEQLRTSTIGNLERHLSWTAPSLRNDYTHLTARRSISYSDFSHSSFNPEKRQRTFSPWNVYQYPVLPAGHIRLLRFKSNPIFSPWGVSFDLIQVPLDGLPPYEALSYRWSSKDRNDKVSCSGESLHVSANCKAALKHLNKENRLLWVDAICINQGDKSEKNHQVALMSRIYRHAERTIAWLGEDADLAASCLADINEAQSYFDRDKDSSTHNRNNPIVAMLEDESLGPPMAFNKLLSRDWFSRIWILQEVALAREILVSCGNQATPWNSFMNVLRELKAKSGLPKGCWAAWNLETFRKDYQRNGPERGVSIHAAMVQSRQCEATDPSDKVYALLGVCPELAKEIGEPDYSLPSGLVWTRAQRACFSGRLTVNALSLVSVGERRENTIPTWVPDLSTGLKTWPRRPPPPTLSDGPASISLCSSGQDLPCLHIRGKSVDTLMSPFEYTHNASFEDIVAQWRNWWTRYEELSTGQPMSAMDKYFAYWSTLYSDSRDSLPKTGALLTWHRRVVPVGPPNPLSTRPLDNNTEAFRDVKASDFVESTVERIFGLTDQRRIGLFPKNARVGDQVVLFNGGSTPYLVRPAYYSPGTVHQRRRKCHRRLIPGFELVGPCYVHDLAYGQARAKAVEESVEMVIF